MSSGIKKRVNGNTTQEVCPFNRLKFVQITREKDFAARPGTSGPKLIELMGMDEATWEELSRGSAIRRARRAGFLGNAAVALGNWGSPDAVPAPVRGLEDTGPLVRGYAA